MDKAKLMPERKPLASEKEKSQLRRITSLFDQIGGLGQGRRLLDPLLKTDDLPIASEIAG